VGAAFGGGGGSVEQESSFLKKSTEKRVRVLSRLSLEMSATAHPDVFWFFFSKKKGFL
jgi:hypothetical protein